MIFNSPLIESAVEVLRQDRWTLRSFLSCEHACKEIAALMNGETDGIDPHKLADEYERLKKIMPHYPSEGELMRIALQNMERVVI